MNTTIVWLHGATGRMGRAIQEVAGDFNSMAILALAREGSRPTDKPAVIIDFSLPDGLISAVQMAAEQGVPLVSGTTGLVESHWQALDELSRRQPVLHAHNFSLGLAATRKAAALLGGLLDWDCEIVETHHRLKRDAPSGTALSLVESVRSARSQDVSWQDRMAESRLGERRQPGSLGIGSLRGGSVVGDHSVHFLGDGERVELTHRADDRRIFARGALHAAQKIIGRPTGRYQLDQVLWG
ncbi:4-hydroxy-tetrahydrodipicolinate reductase [Pseudomarimonas arenosa]|uniref:4-hydroxy-tetrahydrodipicolinate reductase n=1 Tax=Pseudomarimonas arenosa TaxID=2774145 RepID=A0AAW3ZII0_9GAMM|nr:4-hydroxy-tetrahydrodipicolinate reductase [Pseudomarimonas arenosa]MBD8524519.1 4-hydroxy-tetrahydrodipicolinate reductase [Pseudomarimonas arenosa]